MSEDMPRTWWDGTDYRWLYDEPRRKLPGAYSLRGNGEGMGRRGWVELKPVSAEPSHLELYGISGTTDAIADGLTGEPAWLVNLAGRLLRDAADLLRPAEEAQR